MTGTDQLIANLGLGDSLGTMPNSGALGMGNVYMGKREVQRRQFDQEYGLVPKTVNEDYFMNLNEARMQPQKWTDKQRDEFVRTGVMRKIPGFNENMGLPEILAQWDDMATLSSKMNQQGVNMSPWDIMNTYKNREGTTYKKGNWEYDAVTDQPVKYVGPTSKTDTSTRTDLSTREDALALAKTSMAQILGRAPRPEELNNYLSLLNGYERANPTTSSTTSTIDPTSGEVVSSATTSGGGATQAGRQALLTENMLGTDEAGAYQAATTYMSALMQEVMRG